MWNRGRLQGVSRTPSARFKKDTSIQRRVVSPRNSLASNRIRKHTTNQIKRLLWIVSELIVMATISTALNVCSRHHSKYLKYINTFNVHSYTHAHTPWNNLWGRYYSYLQPMRSQVRSSYLVSTKSCHYTPVILLLLARDKRKSMCNDLEILVSLNLKYILLTKGDIPNSSILHS